MSWAKESSSWTQNAVSASASTPAPKKDQIKGSKTNKKGSSKDKKSASSIKFSARVEKSLKNKVEEHNKKAKKGRKVTMSMLKAVYRRGAGAFSTSHRPGKTRDQWAMARVNAFLKLVRSGRPSNSAYKQDNDLLPSGHPKSTKKSNSITSSALVPEEQALADAISEVVKEHGKFNEDEEGVWAGYTAAKDNEDAKIGVSCSNCVFYGGGSECKIIDLEVEALGKCRFAIIPDSSIVKDEELFTLAPSLIASLELYIDTPEDNVFENEEDAILSLTEVSGLGYEAEFAIKASWLRALAQGEDPYKRAKELSFFGYNNERDSDLLPYREN